MSNLFQLTLISFVKYDTSVMEKSETETASMLQHFIYMMLIEKDYVSQSYVTEILYCDLIMLRLVYLTLLINFN